MGDLLKPVRTVKKVQNNIEKFESLSLKEPHLSRNETLKLIPSAANLQRPIEEIETIEKEDPSLSIVKSQKIAEPKATATSEKVNVKKQPLRDSTAFIQQSYLNETSSLSLPDNAREILRNQPGNDDLTAVLQYLQFGIEGRHDFNIRVTSSNAAQIINVLVTVTIPDVWSAITQKELSTNEAWMKKTLVSVLSSVAGIGALLAQIKQLATGQKTTSLLCDTISVLAHILKGHKSVLDFLRDAQDLYPDDSTRRLFWQELTSLLAGSRILSTVAHAISTLDSSYQLMQPYLWLGNGIEYTTWLAKNINTVAIKLPATDEESWKAIGQLVTRGLGLGHRDIFVSEIYTALLLGQRALWTPIHLVMNQLAPHAQKSFFDSILSNLTRKHLVTGSNISQLHDPSLQKAIAGAAALIAGLISNNEALQYHVEAWLTGSSGTAASTGLASRRALLTALGRSEVKLERILEKSLSSFGDKLQIQHSSVMQQEAMAQTILLVAGSLCRINLRILKIPPVSTLVMHAVSNRLAASTTKPRLLGMIIGTAISKLVDDKDKIMDFDVEEMDSEDVKLWLDIIMVDDKIGAIADLPSAPSMKLISGVQKERRPVVSAVRRHHPPGTSKIIAIEEVLDSSESEDDDDLVPYQKPDSDPEDSDDDPTLINRSKPSAPVYIVDLIKQLQATDKPDVVALALKTAPALIKRKTGFGTELSDNVQTLVTILINLQEGVTDPDLERLRLDSLILCIVAKPDLVAPSMADLYFRGDFALSQRIIILTAIGLASRELAGLKDGRAVPKNDNFPSKRLPAHLEPQRPAMVSYQQSPIAAITDTAAHAIIRPMALTAADKVTGPSALKIRTFSSRMDVERKNRERTAARTKIIPKNLHKILTEFIFIPLCSRMSLVLSHCIGGRPSNTTILHSSTMRLFLQTLTLVLHTLGPSAGLYLSTINHEALLLMINLHNIPELATDAAVLPSLLHLLLALIDISIEAGVTAQERLITDHGAQVAELVNWSNSLSGRVSIPDADGEGTMPWSVLAAGIQVKWFEIGKRFQSRMLGLTMDEMDQLSGN